MGEIGLSVVSTTQFFFSNCWMLMQNGETRSPYFSYVINPFIILSSCFSMLNFCNFAI